MLNLNGHPAAAIRCSKIQAHPAPPSLQLFQASHPERQSGEEATAKTDPKWNKTRNKYLQRVLSCSFSLRGIAGHSETTVDICKWFPTVTQVPAPSLLDSPVSTVTVGTVHSAQFTSVHTRSLPMSTNAHEAQWIRTVARATHKVTVNRLEPVIDRAVFRYYLWSTHCE